MELTAIKDLMAQFDASSLREFSYKNGVDELLFSKNETVASSPVEGRGSTCRCSIGQRSICPCGGSTSICRSSGSSSRTF